MHAKQVRNIIVIGCGLHFKIRHYVALTNSPFAAEMKIHLVVDLKSEEEKIKTFFMDKELKPDHYLFLTEENRNKVDIESFHQQVCQLVNLKKIDGILVCTEPKVHKPYILWGIRNNFNIFSDKPLTAFASIIEKNQLYQDYQDIKTALQDKDLNFVLCCDRRGHLGYQYLRDYVSEIIQTYRVPITYMGIHYGDGVWNMPDEYFSRENHPHKYGYGVLLHSGYHYIDLLMSFMSLNRQLYPFSMTETEVFTLLTSPNLFLKTIPNEVYQKQLGTNRFAHYFQNEMIEKMQTMGETDAMVMGRFNYQNQIISNFSLNLLEATATQRSTDQLPENLYLMNGRMHLENVIIHMGPLCSIEVNINHFIKQEQADGLEDFSVTIMRNAEILKASALTRLNRKNFSYIYPDLKEQDSMNVKSRAWQLLEFLQGRKGNSAFSSHHDSVFLLDAIFKGVIPHPTFKKITAEVY